jgi:hypothetical protein
MHRQLALTPVSIVASRQLSRLWPRPFGTVGTGPSFRAASLLLTSRTDLCRLLCSIRHRLIRRQRAWTMVSNWTTVGDLSRAMKTSWSASRITGQEHRYSESCTLRLTGLVTCAQVPRAAWKRGGEVRGGEGAASFPTIHWKEPGSLATVRGLTNKCSRGGHD